MKSVWKMKAVLTSLVFGIIMLLTLMQSTYACEIELNVIEGKKDNYTKGDEFVAKITVALTHRNCPEGIQNTEFKQDGVKILSATKWQETSTGVFERKLKIQVTDSKNGKVSVTAIRTCNKEGGIGNLIIKTNPVK